MFDPMYDNRDQVLEKNSKNPEHLLEINFFTGSRGGGQLHRPLIGYFAMPKSAWMN